MSKKSEKARAHEHEEEAEEVRESAVKWSPQDRPYISRQSDLCQSVYNTIGWSHRVSLFLNLSDRSMCKLASSSEQTRRAKRGSLHVGNLFAVLDVTSYHA